MRSKQNLPLAGVIDIGSNSVRLVVYDRLKRVPRPLFNEKALCGLGEGLHHTGKLNKEGKKLARKSIARFVYIARTMEVSKLFCIATAAIRDSKDGKAFIKQLESDNDIKIRVISGEREAYLAAQGILASIHEPGGIVADLGGGSVELVELKKGKITHQETFPIGALRLLDACGNDPDAIRARVRKTLAKAKWLESGYKQFYAIGGGFRAIARVHMREHHYPLRILHHYTVETESLFSFCSHMLSLSEKELAALKGLQESRVDILAPSVIVFEEIIRATRAERVVFSAAGIREGLLFDKLSAREHGKDALTSSLYALTGKEAHDNAYAERVFAWQTPLFAKENKQQARMRRALCFLSEVAQAVNPDFRAEWAFEHLLVAALYGISHRERVMLALALYHRYKNKNKLQTPMLELITKEDMLWARLAGQSAGLAFDLSAGVPALLKKVTLKANRGALSLHGPKDALSTLPATVEKRLEGLGTIYKAFSSRAK